MAQNQNAASSGNLQVMENFFVAKSDYETQEANPNEKGEPGTSYSELLGLSKGVESGMTHGALPFSRTLGLNLRSGAEDDPVSGLDLNGGLFEEPLTYSSEMKKKELKRFKHQSQKLDMTQAKSISKKHPQRRK
ncbi:hypothetical protein PPACK8108_LOCUS13288 [Phakopsora pachyrhizi]|uniref:Uncharacterized protein n=1 Tax=Phakopsora pachyrhizi TaxID=170000 RepID=A0AAV0B6D1_PHAPC|nr:hypothetical protein PPACK8108_LOCUS13288 [Phakopsora pachyrhizi]